MADPSQAEPGGSEHADEPKAGHPAQHDEPQPLPPQADDGTGGSEFKRLPDLMKRMLYQFDRTLGFNQFGQFCNQLTDNLRTDISKNSQQPFLQTFTKARKKIPDDLELELARTCNGGYIPKHAIKFARGGRFQKWIADSEATLLVMNDRPQPLPQPQTTDQSGVKAGGMGANEHLVEKAKAVAVKSQEAKREKRKKKDDDEDEDEDDAARGLRATKLRRR
jgi:hypothetical protein